PVEAMAVAHVEVAATAGVEGRVERDGLAEAALGFRGHRATLPEAGGGPGDLAPHQEFRRTKTATLRRIAASTEARGVLYQLYDWQRTALEPWRLMAQMANEFYGHPASPASWLPGARRAAAAFDLMG